MTTAGSYSAALSYPGDNNYIPQGPSTAATVVINKLAPTLTITTSTATANLGDTFTFTATVVGATGVNPPSGTGSFSITGVTGASCTSANPVAPTSLNATSVTYSCVVIAHTAGIYVPLFTFNGDLNYSATTPASGFTTQVAKATPTVSVDETPTATNLGQSITFTATVAGPTNAVAPTASNVTWAITGVSGVTSCTSTTGPTPSGASSTYTCVVVASRAGTYGATFTFPGDSGYDPVASTPSAHTQLVSPATPNVVLTSSGTPTLGGSLTFTTTVTGSANALAPAGVASYSISLVSTAGTSNPTCSNGAASTTGVSVGVVTTYTCILATPTAGTYSVQATIASDGNYALASSSPVAVLLAKQTPLITLTPSASPALNSVMTLTATVTGVSGASQPSAGVTFAVTSPLSSVTLTCATPNTTPSSNPSANVAIYTCSFTPTSSTGTGTYTATATIGSDTNYNSATSSPLTTITIASAAPSISLIASPSSTAVVGTALTFTAIVTGTSSDTPSGTLNWNLGGAATGGCTSPATGVADTGQKTETFTCTIPTPNVGTYTVNATYNGDSTYSSITYPTAISITVTPATPTISVAAPSALFGGTITYTATVTGPANATPPAGAVSFTLTGPAGATTTCASTTGPLAGSGVQSLYTCAIAASPAGTYSAVATFNGNNADTNYLSATSSLTSITIAKATPTVALTSSGGATYGSTITFTATVSGTSGAASPSDATANAGVLWNISGSGGITACSNTSVSGTGSPSGSVTTYICTITSAGNGSYVVIANYQGDRNYLAAASNQVTVTIATNSATVGAITPTTSPLGGSVTLSVLVTGSSTFAPIGSVSWNISAPFFTPAISGLPVSCSTTTGPVAGTGALSNTATYTCTIPTATAGSYSATANFSGDVHYNSASSPVATIVVDKQPPVLAVTGIQSSTSNGQIITFTATVTGVVGSVAPTGTPTWTLTGPSGSIASCASQGTPSVSTVTTSYTCVIPALTSGSYTGQFSVTADDNYFSAGPSNIASVNVTKLNPSVVVTTSATSVALGSAFTFTATVTGPTTGPTPTGSGTWTVAGVSGVSCSPTAGPIGTTYSVTYTCSVLASAAGTYIPVFTYAGDSNYFNVAPTSGATTTVIAATPTVSVVPGAATAALGSTISFTATVTGPANAVAPTGTGIWVITGVTGVTTCSSTSGPNSGSNVSTYDCSVVASRAGTYGATFTYPGDSAYNAAAPATSSSTTVVAIGTPTVALGASNAPTLGGTITYTATVTGSLGAVAPYGVVNWSVSGSGGLTSCPTTAGPNSTGITSTYTCIIPTAQAGTYIVTALFAGDANYAIAASNTLTSTLAQQLPAIVVASSSNPTLGGTTTLTTTVTGVAGAVQPTGAVSWTITDPSSQSVTCVNPTGPSTNSNVSTYTCTFVTSLAGNYVITSKIASDVNYLLATSSAININLGTSVPSIAVNSSPTSPVVGATLTFSAVVSGSAQLPAPTGTLTWSISGAATSCTSSTPAANGAHTATYTCSVFAANAGTYNATATYNGDLNFSSLSPEAATPIVVTAATPSIVVTVPVINPVLGGVITYSATVTGAVGATAPGSSLAWGFVGPASSCASETGPTGGVQANQTVYTCTVNASQAGNYSATATYGGDSNYTNLASVSSSTVVIAKTSPSVVLTASGGTSLGSTLTFTAVVTGTAGSVAPVGNMTWTLSGPSGINACSSTTPTSHTGVATTYSCAITASSYGTYILTGLFVGDVNYLAADSNSASLTISTLIPTVTISVSNSPTLGGTSTLTALVAATSSPNPQPAGIMSWTVSDPSGNTIACTNTASTLDTSAYPLSTTSYQCTFPTATAGTYHAQANFPGDSNYVSLNSSTIAIPVAKVAPVSMTVEGVQSSSVSGPIITYTAKVTGVAGSVVPSATSVNWTLTGPTSTCASTSGPVTSGLTAIYNCVVPANVAATYTALINYPGDGNYTIAGPSGTATIVIAKLAPSVVITTSTPTATVGSTFTFTATVSGPTTGVTPSGTGTWTISGVTGVNCANFNGPIGSTYSVTYNCSVLASVNGTYLPVFTYGGDSNYFATAPTSGAQTVVSPATPLVAVTANSSSSSLGSTLVFTATVTGPIGAVSPSALGSWAITGVTGVTSCSATTGPIGSSNVSTYTCSVIASLAGTYGATFTYPGDTSYTNVAATVSTSTTFVDQATPSVSISASGSPILGASLIFTATVAGSTGAVAPTGTLTFALTGSSGVATCTSESGASISGTVTTYTCTITTINAGTYIAVANYPGDPNYKNSSSSSITLTLAKQLPVIGVTASSNPVLGGTTTLTTNVTGVSGALQPTGGVSWTITDPANHSVTCLNPTGPLTTSNVSIYTCTFVTSVAGTYTVTSTIAPDTNYLTITSAPISVNLGTSTPTISVTGTSSPLSQTVGNPLTFTALITGTFGNPAPVGTISWTVSGAATTCTNTGGPTNTGALTETFTCQIATPVSGTYTVLATFNGDSNYAAVAYTPVSLTVAPATPSIAVTTSPSSPVLGGTITYTATVTGISGATAPAGTITWVLSGPSGSASTCSSPTGPLPGATSNLTVFTCTVSAIPAGSYTATAAYSGDTNYAALSPATSPIVVIAQVIPTVILSATGTGSLGSVMTFTLQVTGSGGVAPTGTVLWTFSGSGGNTVSACDSPVVPSSTGAVTAYICNVTANSYGNYVVSARYPGDINFTALTSNTVTLNVSILSPTITLAYTGTPVLGGTLTLTATSVGPLGKPAPAGSMAWTVLDPTGAPVTCGIPTVNTLGLTPPTTAYTCVFPTTLAGNYSATANFPGDSNYSSSNSPIVTIAVPKANPSLNVIGVQTTTGTGQVTTFTATITGSTGSVAPTGAPVWILTGTSDTSCTASTSTITGPVNSGVSSIFTCQIPSNSSGAYSAAITYPGDTNYYSAGPSSPFSINIAKATPTVRVTTSNATVALGSTFTFTATVTGPTGGAVPTGTGTWSITGVTGIACASTAGPTPFSSIASTFTCSVTASKASNYLPLFTYSGDSNYNSTSPTSGDSTTVTPSTPTVTVAADVPSAALGTTISFTATVTGPPSAIAPTNAGSWAITGVGSVTACASITGPSAVSAGVYTYGCRVVATVAGTYGANFIFTGDTSYNLVASTSSSSTIVIAAATPTVVLSNTPSSPILGNGETITATVTGATNAAPPSGNLSWTIGGTAGAGACRSNTGASTFGNTTTYTCTFDTPNVGTYTAIATYAGDSNYLTATSSTMTLTILKQDPGISVLASPNPILGQPVTLTTTVTGFGFAIPPTGAVTWLITDPASTVIPCQNISSGNTVGNVVTYTCSFTPRVPGAYRVNSTVAADSNYNTATSSTIPVNLGTILPTINLLASPTSPTTGQALSFTALVNGVANLPAPTGTVVFAVSGKGSSCSTTPTPTSSGTSTTYICNIDTPTAGAYTVTASYNGDTNYAAISAGPTTLTVALATPSIALGIAPAAPTLGNVITFTATVSGAPGAVKPSGTLVWVVTGGQKAACDSQSGPTPGISAIATVYTCVINAQTAGNYTVTATYPGDTNFTPLPTTSPITVTIAPVTPAIVLTGVGDPAVGGTAVFTATVTGPTGALPPSAAISWAISGTTGVNSCTGTPTQTTSGSTTTYVCNITEVNYGNYIVTASYPGDSNYLAAVSNQIDIGVHNLTPIVSITLSASGSPTLGGATKITALVTGPTGTSSSATGNTTYSCAPSVGTLSGSNCIPAPTITAATTSYTCSSPSNLSGTTCVDTSTQPSTVTNATTVYTCDPTAGVLTGATCVLAGVPIAATPSTTYTCPSGARLAGSICLTGDFVPAGDMHWTIIDPNGLSTTCSTVPSGIDTSGDVAPTTAYSCSFPTAYAGTYQATANFHGDTNYDSANSAPVPVAVAQVTPTISVTGTAASNQFRAPITFTAVVSGVAGSTAPSGAITWNLGGPASSCHSGSTTGSVSGVSTTYSCTIDVSVRGTYTANISLAGDQNYLSVTNSTSSASVTEGPGTPSITFNSTPAVPNLGDTLTITATVNPSPGAPLPSGTVTWSLTGSAGITTCDSTPPGGNVFTCIVVARAAGMYVAQAAYLGDNNYYPVTQVAPSISIARALPTVSVLHSGNPNPGPNSTVAFNAIVTGVNTANDPTGTFVWSITGTANTSTCVPTVASISVAHALTFTCIEPLPTVGTYVASGVYSGDNNYLSNSATTPDVVTLVSNNPTYLPVTLGAITNFKVVPSGYDAVVPVSATWDALPGAGQYAVQVGTSPTTLQSVTCVDNTANSCIIKNLVSGTTYYFWVNGYQLDSSNTAIGQGTPATFTLTLPAYSRPIIPPVSPPPSGGLPTVTVPLPLAAPALTGVGADKQVTLSWSNPKDDNRTGYLLDYSLDGQTFSKAVTLGASVGSAVVTGLSNGVSTIFRLTPMGKAGNGVAATASATPGVVSQPPTSFTAQSGDSQVDLSWIAPVDTGGLKINNYVIEESTDGTNWTLASTTPGGTTQVNLQGLKNYTNYTFRVSAITNFGKGLSVVLATNASALPSAPLSLHIVSTASKTVTIGWTLPTGATAGSISGYQIEQSIDGSVWTNVVTASGTAVSAAISGLTNGTTYEIRVTPVAGSGQGASSVILVAPGSAPDSVTALSATAGDKKVTLNFTTPATNGGYSIDYYTVDMGNSASGPWKNIVPNSGSSLTKINIPSLNNGTTYFFRVAAVNQIGVGPVSSVVSGTPQPAAPAPVIKTFVLSPTSATITWIPALGSNTKLILSFLVETSPDGLKWTTAKSVSARTNIYTVTRAKAALLIRVRAVTSIGPGVPTLGVRVPGTTATIVVPTPKPTASPKVTPKKSAAPFVAPKPSATPTKK